MPEGDRTNNPRLTGSDRTRTLNKLRPFYVAFREPKLLGFLGMPTFVVYSSTDVGRTILQRVLPYIFYKPPALHTQRLASTSLQLWSTSGLA
jgi:hypothetical protein